METKNSTLSTYWLSAIGLCLLIFSGLQVCAQQEPNYSQFMYNKLPINPAYAGSHDLWSMRLVYRDQWTQLEGHPRTISASANGPLPNDNIGLGVNIVHDEVGLVKNTWVGTAYAYRIKVNPGGKQDMKVNMGVNAGIMLYNANLLGVDPVEDNDPTFYQSVSRVIPDVGAGIYFTGKNFYVSASVPNFLPSDLHAKEDKSNLPDNITSKRVPHFFTMAGGLIPLGKEGNVKLRPQIMTKSILSKEYNAPVEIDVNVSLMMYDWVNIGLTYRTSAGNAKVYSQNKLSNMESITCMVEFWPTKRLLIGYAFDYSLNELKQYNNGTHEVVLGYDLEPKKKKGKALGCYHF